MHRWVSLVALLAVTTGCADAETGDADGASQVVDTEALRQYESQLIEADRRFARAVERHGLGAWLENFAPTGRLVVGGESYIGPEGVRRALLPIYADTTFSVTWDPNYAEVAASGDLGYTVGRYERRAVVDGEAVVDSGTYLTVWTRQPNGTWKVKADIGNPDAEE